MIYIHFSFLQSFYGIDPNIPLKFEIGVFGHSNFKFIGFFIFYKIMIFHVIVFVCILIAISFFFT
jgi:hypothetical protein